MTREEAIRRIKSWNLDSDDMEVLSVVIPELAESEDERIRKELIEAFIEAFEVYDIESSWNQIPVKRILAWLEKRKEQKPVSISCGHENDKPAEWSEEDNIGWDEAFACVTRAEKAAKNEEELQNAITAEKWLKEIKFKYYVHPIKQEWSEKDEEMLNNIIEHLKVAYCACSWLPETLIWLKSLKKRFSYQTK